MSVSFSCHCQERKKPINLRNWVVIHYKCNYSHFEYPKGCYHSSDYSLVFCKSCRALGRTKADYVNELKHGEIN